MSQDSNTKAVPLGFGRVWTTDAHARQVTLEEAVLRMQGTADGQCSAVAVAVTPAPVIVECSIAAPGAPEARLQVQLTMVEWGTLRASTGGRGALSLLLAPSVIARFRPQAWVNDHALDVDDGAEEFEVLPGIFETYPKVADFVEQIRRREWDDLATYSAAAGRHSGPYEVELDPDSVLVLAAMYKGDSSLVSDLLAGDESAATRLTQDDWEKAGALVQVLSPRLSQIVEAEDTVESLFLEALAAFEGEESSVRAEHRRLISRMQAVARTMPGREPGELSADGRAAERPRHR